MEVSSERNDYFITAKVHMPNENDLATFTVRIPKNLEQQIQARAELHRRSRNAECQLLLEMALDLAVQRDLKMLQDKAH